MITRTRRQARRLAAMAGAVAAVALLAACESKVTLDNYQQIKPGMTLTEVTQILGPGKEEEQSSGTSIDSYGLMSKSQGDSPDKVYVWKDGGKKIVVTLAKGKVVQVSQEGLQ